MSIDVNALSNGTLSHNEDEEKTSEFFDTVHTIYHEMEENEDEFIFQSIGPFCNQVCRKHVSKKELIEALTLYREVQSLENMGMNRYDFIANICNGSGIDRHDFIAKIHNSSDIARKAYEKGREAGKAEIKERIINAMENSVGGETDE